MLKSMFSQVSAISTFRQKGLTLRSPKASGKVYSCIMVNTPGSHAAKLEYATGNVNLLVSTEEEIARRGMGKVASGQSPYVLDRPSVSAEPVSSSVELLHIDSINELIIRCLQVDFDLAAVYAQMLLTNKNKLWYSSRKLEIAVS